MKITNILKEQFDMPFSDDETVDRVQLPQNDNLQFNDLTTYQVAVIKRLADGTLTVDNANDKALDAINELIEFGILDDNVEFTERGNKVLQKAQGGSYDLRRQRELHGSSARVAPQVNDKLPMDSGEFDDSDDSAELDFGDNNRRDAF